jgi:HrpA-like RNA helicase
MTDGMAIRELMVRKQFDVFVLDEAHERSINTDVLISVLKKILFETKMKIKIVIMSATIDSAKFMNFYNTDALINIEGRSYPTEIYNLFEPVDNYVDAMFNAIMQVHEK